MKRLLYYTDVLPILSKEDIALDKLERNLKLMSESRDMIKVVWHPYVRTEEFLELNKSKTIDRYKQIKEKYCNDGFGEFDESDDLKALAKSCDAYYGDYSDAVYYMQEDKKPVMLENMDI